MQNFYACFLKNNLHPSSREWSWISYEVLKDSVTVDFDLSHTMKKTSLDTHQDMLSHMNPCPEDLLWFRNIAEFSFSPIFCLLWKMKFVCWNSVHHITYIIIVDIMATPCRSEKQQASFRSKVLSDISVLLDKPLTHFKTCSNAF